MRGGVGLGVVLFEWDGWTSVTFVVQAPATGPLALRACRIVELIVCVFPMTAFPPNDSFLFSDSNIVGGLLCLVTVVQAPGVIPTEDPFDMAVAAWIDKSLPLIISPFDRAVIGDLEAKTTFS